MRWLILTLALLPTAALAAAEVGYVRASSQLAVEEKPTLHTPLHLLDARNSTVWCEGAEGDGTGEKLVVGFKEFMVIDEVRLVTGHAKDAASFEAHNRVKKLVLKEPRSVHRLMLVDSREVQVFKLDPPIESERVEIEIAGVVKGTGPDDAACLADIVFFSEGKPVNGPFLANRLKHDKGRAQLMNTWYAGPRGAPDRFLHFFFDGTFHYVYRPFDPEHEGVELWGEYVVRRDSVRLKVPEKGWVEVETRRRDETDEDGTVRTILELVSESLQDTLAATWADVP